MKKIITLATFVMAFVLNASPYNIFMTGDSHICSNIYPETVGDILSEADPEIDFDYWGKVGAGFYTFNNSEEMMQHIYDAEPSILIVHLGTNDCYSPKFRPEKFLSDLEEFYGNVSERFPDCKMVFVTPFFNKFKNGKLNEQNRKCADAYLEFAENHKNAYVIDNNATHGMYFLEGGKSLIRPDNVHLTAEGYKQLGEQVGSALLSIEDLWLLSE